MLRQIFRITLTLFYFYSIANAYTIDKGTNLLNTVDQQNFEKVKELINSGVNINEKGKVGITPLIMATAWSNLEMVDYLIKHGANLNDKTDRGSSIIHSASMNKNPSILKYLLKNFKLNVNDRGKRYCSPLDISLRANALQNNGTLENARLLLEYGAKESINWKCNGYTPLMVAVPDKKVINFLIQNGADKTIKNKAGLTAYDMAKRQNASADILAILTTQTEYKSKINNKIFQNDMLLWELKTNQNRYDRYTENEATKYCTNLNVEGHSHWRIPSTAEYQTILSEKPYQGFVIDGVDEYYMNPKDFPNMTPSSYWVILEDKSLGYQSTSWNKVHKKREYNEKHHIRCVHTK